MLCMSCRGLMVKCKNRRDNVKDKQIEQWDWVVTVCSCQIQSPNPQTPFLYECIWVQGKMSFLSLLPNSSFQYKFKCLLAELASLSLPWRPGDACLLTRCRLTSLPAPLAGFKSLKNTSVTLTYSPPEQARGLSVDLSGGHKSGKLQWGKIRELSLAGICARWISTKWAGDCSVCDLYCSWLCVKHLAYVCLCIFNLYSPRECQPKAHALFQGCYGSFLLSSFGVHHLLSPHFKTKYVSTCWQELPNTKASTWRIAPIRNFTWTNFIPAMKACKSFSHSGVALETLQYLNNFWMH